MKYCRLTPNDKLPDRFLFSGVLANPNDTLYIFYIIEITKPWFPTSRVAPVIINELKSNLARLSGTGELLPSFEDTLKDINEALFNLSEQGETEWISNLNSLVAVVKNQDIHLAQTGSLPGYLFRKQKISQITEGLSLEKETHPLKTFSSIISGTITNDDKLLLANHELFNVISLDMLRQLVVNNSPYQASFSILKALRKHNAHAVCSIIINPAKKSATEPEPEVIIIEEGFDRWYKKVWRVAWPKAIQLGKAVKVGGLATHQIIKEKVSPKVRSVTKKGFAGAVLGSKLAASYTQNKVLPAVRGQVEKIILKRTSEQEKERKEMLKANGQLERTGLFSKNFKKSIAKMGTTTKNFLLPLLTKKVIYILAAVILIIAAGFFIFRKPNEKEIASQNSQTKQAISSIENSIVEAEKYQALKNNEKAIETLFSAQEKLQKIDSKSYIADKNRLTKQITNSLDQLTSSIRIESAAKYSFSDNSIDQLEVISPFFFTSSSKNGQIYRLAPGSLAEAKEAEIKPKTEISRGVKDLFLAEENETTLITVISGDGQLFRIIQSGNSSTITDVPYPLGKFAAADAAEGYLGNLYLLDGTTGLLWKYPPSAGSFGKGTNQVNIGEVNLKGSRSIAIDGLIYVLKEDGAVYKLLKGIPEKSFNLASLPGKQKLAKPLKIMTTKKDSSIFILDGGIKSRQDGRVVEFDKNGAFIRQYILPKNLTAIKDAIIKTTEKKLYVLSESTVYDFSLP